MLTLLSRLLCTVVGFSALAVLVAVGMMLVYVIGLAHL